MRSKTYLAWCPHHGFVTSTELFDVTYLPTASCGCFGCKTIKSLKEAIKIAGKLKYSTWHKNIKIGNSLFIQILGYKDHFWPLKRIQYKLQTIWRNLRNIGEEH